MPLPDEAMLEKIQEGVETLRPLSDTQIIMAVLCELIMEAKDIPPGPRYALLTEMRRRVDDA